MKLAFSTARQAVDPATKKVAEQYRLASQDAAQGADAPRGTCEAWHPWPASDTMDRRNHTESLAATAPNAHAEVDEDTFGVRNGTTITNKDTIMQDVWRALGHDQPPDLLVIHTRGLGGIGIWGHALVAYRHPETGKMVCVNVVTPANGKGSRLLNWLSLEDFLFGVGDNVYRKTQQYGAFNRGMDMIPIWHWPKDKIRAMHDCFVKEDERFDRGEVGFGAIFSNLVDTRPTLTGKEYKARNCAGWTSEGLVAAGLIDKPSLFPKKMMLRVLQQEGNRDPANVDLVNIPWVQTPHYVTPKPPIANSRVSALNVFATNYPETRDLSDLASVRVVVPRGSRTAEVQVRSDTMEYKLATAQGPWA